MEPARKPTRLAALAAAMLGMVVLSAGCANAPAPGSDGGSGEDTSGNTDSRSAGRLLSKTSLDGHKLRQVPGDEAPSVRLEVEPDPDSGWNVHLSTDRFAFTPEQVGGKARPGEGHAHLYLDGEKIARLYSDWYYLSGDAVPKGKHALTVQLSADDHTAWAVNGKMVSDTVRLTGTGESTGHQHNHQNGDQSGTQPADVEVDIEVTGGEVSPAPGRVEVEQGERVRIRVTSDQADTVHVHGYDLEAPVSPKQPADLAFTADQTGVFEVETHEGGQLLTQLQIQ